VKKPKYWKREGLPQGPEGIFNGKHVPCFCCCSYNGGITGQLLKHMFEAIGNPGIFTV
jgi:hypothetical protein